MFADPTTMWDKHTIAVQEMSLIGCIRCPRATVFSYGGEVSGLAEKWEVVINEQVGTGYRQGILVAARRAL